MGWSGWRPSRRSAPGWTRTAYQPRQWPSGPMPQDRSTRISPGPKGAQSMPRSRSQARRAAMGWRLPGRFSRAATVTQSVVGVSMAPMLPDGAAGVTSLRAPGAAPPSGAGGRALVLSAFLPAPSAAPSSRPSRVRWRGRSRRTGPPPHARARIGPGGAPPPSRDRSVPAGGRGGNPDAGEAGGTGWPGASPTGPMVSAGRADTLPDTPPGGPASLRTLLSGGNTGPVPRPGRSRTETS